MGFQRSAPEDEANRVDVLGCLEGLAKGFSITSLNSLRRIGSGQSAIVSAKKIVVTALTTAAATTSSSFGFIDRPTAGRPAEKNLLRRRSLRRDFDISKHDRCHLEQQPSE